MEEISLNTQDLEYVLCVAKHQNLTKASQELYISQPTLSKFLQKLERELNGKLFIRSGNRYVPTHLGRRYLQYARHVLDLHHDWEKELEDLNACRTGELNIAMPAMRSACMVPRVLPEFHRQYPGVRINLFEESSAVQEKLLLDDQLDFAIFNEGRENPDLQYETLLQEEILLVLPSGHPLAGAAVSKAGFSHPWMDLRLLKDQPFILHFEDQTTGAITRQLFEYYDIQPPVYVRTRSPLVCLQLCLQGLGACLVPQKYVETIPWSTAAPDCFSMGEEGVFSHLTIASRKGSYLPAYAQEFIRIAKEFL